MSFWNKISNKFSKSENNNDDVESSVVNAIIKVCYAYDTTPYVKSIDEAWPDSLSLDDKKALDPVISCLSLGIAIRFLRNRYGKKSENIIKKLLDRIYSSALSVTNSPDVQSENVANFYVELIDNYSNILDYDAAGVIDYGMGVCEKVFEQVEDLFDQLKPSPSIALFMMTFISEFGSKISGLIETAEEKYDFYRIVKQNMQNDMLTEIRAALWNFIEDSFDNLPSKDYTKEEQGLKCILFELGALDALCQEYKLSTNETVELFEDFLRSEMEYGNEEAHSIAQMAIRESAKDPRNKVMTIGGNALLEWRYKDKAQGAKKLAALLRTKNDI